MLLSLYGNYQLSAFDFFDCMKDRGVLRRYSNESLAAIIFSPVKAISTEYPAGGRQAEDLLDELIQIVSEAILL